MQLEGDGEREPVPRAVVVVVRVGCGGHGGTGDVPRVRFGNGRPAVEREACRDDDSDLLAGEVADTYSAAEQRRPRGEEGDGLEVDVGGRRGVRRGDL